MTEPVNNTRGKERRDSLRESYFDSRLQVCELNKDVGG